MQKKDIYKIVLADDDEDDRLLFREVLEATHKATLEVAEDGRSLMTMLKSSSYIPDAIFLDLNMPFKNGHQCLHELKHDKRLSKVPVVIYSTSNSKNSIDLTYENGASLYIAKPDSIAKLKKMMKQVFELNCEQYIPQPPREDFVLAV